MEINTLYKLIETITNSETSENNESDFSDIAGIVKKYPYFQTARLINTIYLQATGNEQYNSELPKTAILCADRRKLFYLTHKEDYSKFIKLFEDKPGKESDRTEQLLDSYFKTFDYIEQDKPKEDDIEISIASTDYFTYLDSLGEDKIAEQSNDNPMQHQDIIDAFIKKNESDSFQRIPFKDGSSGYSHSKESDSENYDTDSPFLTETLAKVYIKQKKYEQALTIIQRLSLNFPKKSAYFADQIRFLEFLILNEKNS